MIIQVSLCPFCLSKCSKSHDMIAITIRDSNRGSQIASEFETVWTISKKLNVLIWCTGDWRCEPNEDLNRDSNHKVRDSGMRFEPHLTAI